ncbi:hypothetical protein EC968_004278 [Mortierella alpina]|nr:hypothetical protein EC968_004278 [Mortierella alpina]
MGLKGVYWWLRKRKGHDPVLRIPTHSSLPDGAKLRIDVLSFFNKIRSIYTEHADDKVKAHSILHAHLKKFDDPLHMVYYVDGLPALEKDTHCTRESKWAEALETAKVALDNLDACIRQGKSPTKQMFKTAEKNLRGGFKWSIQDRRAFVEFLQGQQLDARLCSTEADIAIATDCQPSDHVLSQDSDFFAYESVQKIWRPVGKRVKILEYSKSAILDKTGLSSTKLTALACVSSNDYNKNIKYLGIATNFKVITDMPDADISSLVQRYLESPLVICRDQEDIDFTASILVFTSMTQEIAVPADDIMDPPAPPSISYDHAQAKAQKRLNSTGKSDTRPERQGKRREFRRHRVIDRPAYQPRVSRQVHRQRYSPKARTVPHQNEPPSICRQYSWKPYTADQEAQAKKATAERMTKQAAKEKQHEARRRRKERDLLKKPPPRIEDMSKMQLINAMAWEHPLVSLPVGTINSQVGCSGRRIDSALPAVENYLILNKAYGACRRIAPLSPLAARYVGFSERHLLPLFWAWPTLKTKIQNMMIRDRYFEDPTIVPSQDDAKNWLTKTTPGRLVTTFLSDVGLPSSKHDKGFRKATSVMDLDGKDGVEGLRQYVGRLRAESFDPKEWQDKGYVLRGSIRTNGRLLQLLAFKKKELQSVRFRRLAKDKLPNPLISTIGGTNSYLTEARNVFPTAADVESLLATDPSQVTVLSLDLGTSCVVGATVSLPSGQTPATLKRPLDKEGHKKKAVRRGKRKPGHRNRIRARQKARKSGKRPQTTQHFDLAVKRKAVARPTDDFASWLEDRKQNTAGAITGTTIQDLESTLPPLVGEGASFCDHVAARRAAEGDLDDFYNSTNFWKHKWDSEVCQKEEYYKVAEGLLRMIGGSVGRARLPHQHVVIAVGLAKFTASSGPPSLDSTFGAFFINLARSLGYLVIGVNEYYTLKRCPHCSGFVCATSNWRALYCRTCKCFWHRDVMASENMNICIRSQITDQQRPFYLQPRRLDGSYPWNYVAPGAGDHGGGGSVASARPSRKRPADD